MDERRAGDEHDDGVSIPAGSLVLTAGTERSRAPTAGTRRLTHGAKRFHEHTVNTFPAPELEDIEVMSRPDNGDFYTTGETIELRAKFDAPVTARSQERGMPPDVTLKLQVGNAERSLGDPLGNGSDSLGFLYTVKEGDDGLATAWASSGTPCRSGRERR